MIKDRYITISLKNGKEESGLFELFNDEFLIIKKNDNSTLWIFNPKENILCVKIHEDKIKPESFNETANKEALPLPKNVISSDDLKIKNLIELHKIKAEEERKIAKELLLSNKLSNLKEVEFGIPDLRKLPKPGELPFSKHSKKKTR